MATYKLTTGASVIRATDGATIPADPANADYRDYLDWVAAGNTPDVADPTPAPTYQALRAAAYETRACSDKDYVDAITKQSSTDSTTQAEGTAQLSSVLTARLKVKTDFPKPE